jgi:phosphatidylglycerophosphate synthase
VIAIIAREFLITGLRLLAGSKGVVLPAEKLGKHKTAWQMITILFFLALLALAEWPAFVPASLIDLAWNWIGPGLIAVTVLLTIYSGAAYFIKNRYLIDQR